MDRPAGLRGPPVVLNPSIWGSNYIVRVRNAMSEFESSEFIDYMVRDIPEYARGLGEQPYT